MARPAQGLRDRGGRIYSAPSNVFVFLAVLASYLYPATSQSADPPFCAFSIVDAIDSIVNAAYDILQAATDCTLPSFVELSCAADLTDMLSYWFYCASDISSCTLACGNLDNSCAGGITLAFASSADTSNDLVASASDCVSDPFICTYDVVSAVDDLNNVISAIIGSLTLCRGGDVPFFLTDFTSSGDGFLYTGPASDSGGFFERRLSQASAEDKEVLSKTYSLLGPGSSFAQRLEAIRQRAHKVHDEFAAKSVAALSSDRSGAENRQRQEAFHKLHVAANSTEKAAAFSSMVQAFKSGTFGEMAASKTAAEAKQRMVAHSLPAGSLLI
mmetsp:Transcript_44753/g.96192  ORF Transcript_44753/g.96192 Transcript_44753/m.96192 type:complete len:329 (+) Transcript_44753:137-1123(+)